MTLQSTGLLIGTPLGVLRVSSPVAWQAEPGVTQRGLACGIKSIDSKRFGFDLQPRDPGSSATIDPGITWSTYLGGQHSDLVQFLEAPADGTILAAGVTDSFDFPTTPGSYDPAFNSAGSQQDVFIAKLDPTGSSLLAATYLGGFDDDILGDVDVNSLGQVVVIGTTTSGDFPVTPDAFHSVFNDPLGSSFLSILSPSLAELEYSTCIGGPTLPGAGASRVATTAGHALILLGGTTSPQFVGTPGAYDTSYNGGGDAVVFKFDPTLPSASQIVFATLLGGSNLEYGNGRVAVRTDGSIVVAGSTVSTDFPVSPGAFDTDYGGGFNGYIAALSPDGSELEWATFVKNTGLRELVVGLDGAITASFDTSGSISPVSPAAFDPTPNGGTDGLICRFDSTGSRLQWGSFLGGQGQDAVLGLDVDASGAVLACGRTSSPNFPTTPGAHDISFSGACSDGFVTYLSNDGSQLLYGSYLGSGSSLCLEAEAVKAADVGIALVAGHAPASFPVTEGAYDPTYNGGSLGDGFVVKMPLFTPWTNLGQGLAGTLGVPKLAGTGWLVPGNATTLALTRAKPSSTAAMIIGLSQLSAPFKGGVLVPFPNFLVTGLPVSASGTLTLTATWPAGVPGGLTLYFQEWIVDPAAVAGLSATNALAASTP